MANGATEQIWKIKPGDVVLSYDPETNNFYPNVIVRVLKIYKTYASTNAKILSSFTFI